MAEGRRERRRQRRADRLRVVKVLDERADAKGIRLLVRARKLRREAARLECEGWNLCYES